MLAPVLTINDGMTADSSINGWQYEACKGNNGGRNDFPVLHEQRDFSADCLNDARKYPWASKRKQKPE